MSRQLCAAFLSLFFFSGFVPANAQTMLERWERGQTHDVSSRDPAMRAAYAKARSTLPRFLKLVDAPPDHIEHLLVKLGFPAEGGAEFIWIFDVRKTPAGFSGRIGNRPNEIKHLAEGDPVTFTRQQIVDWSYRDKRTGRFVGNFTGCAILMKQSRADRLRFAEATGLHCD